MLGILIALEVVAVLVVLVMILAIERATSNARNAFEELHKRK